MTDARRRTDAADRRRLPRPAPRGGTGARRARVAAGRGRPAAPTSTDPLAPKPPHFKPTAKSGIFIFLVGGTSQIDLFDPKPELAKLHGKPIPESFREGVRLGQTNYAAPVMQSPFGFRRYGKCGMELSELLPRHRLVRRRHRA